MSAYRNPHDLRAFTRALQEEGLLPEECVSVEMLMPVDGIFQLRYVVNVRTEDLPKLIRALQAKYESDKEWPI